jgi:hypothetical protein
MVFYLQQIWLDQNITQKLASAHKANIYYGIFKQTTVYCWQNEFFSIPCSFTAKFRNVLPA